MNRMLVVLLTEPTVAELGQAIKARREALGWKQTELARRSDVAQPTISRLEAGHGVRPGNAILSKLARALHTTVDELTRPEPVVLPPKLEEMAESGGVNDLPEPERTRRRRALLATYRRQQAEGKLPADDDPGGHNEVRRVS